MLHQSVSTVGRCGPARHPSRRHKTFYRERPGWPTLDGRTPQMVQTRWQWLRFVGTGHLLVRFSHAFSDLAICTVRPLLPSSTRQVFDYRPLHLQNDHGLAIAHHVEPLGASLVIPPNES